MAKLNGREVSESELAETSKCQWFVDEASCWRPRIPRPCYGIGSEQCPKNRDKKIEKED